MFKKLFYSAEPDPIARDVINSSVFGQNNFPVVIPLIPANGIKQEFFVICAAIVERLPINDVLRNGCEIARRERIERVWIGAMDETAALQRTGDEADYSNANPFEGFHTRCFTGLPFARQPR